MLLGLMLFWGLLLSIIVTVFAAVILWQLAEIKRRYDVAIETTGIRIITTLAWTLLAIGAFSIFLFLLFGLYSTFNSYMRKCDAATTLLTPVQRVAASVSPEPTACFTRDVAPTGEITFNRISCAATGTLL